MTVLGDRKIVSETLAPYKADSDTCYSEAAVSWHDPQWATLEYEWLGHSRPAL